MSLIYYKIIAALIIFLISIAIALYPIVKKKHTPRAESMELGEALASGIFLGAAFFHMLPDAVEIFEQIYGVVAYPIPEAICVLGFLLLLFLERLSLSNTVQSKNSIPYILALILIIHALTEGAALGIGLTVAETFMLFIAIIAHKGSESFALSVTMIRHELPLSHIILIVIFFSLMTPLGIVIGATINQFTFIRSGQLLAASFNAFAAGTFLYISTLHHVHFHHHGKDTQGLLEFTSLVIGVVAMGLIALWT